MYVAQSRLQRRGVVNGVLNIGAPYRGRRSVDFLGDC